MGLLSITKLMSVYQQSSPKANTKLQQEFSESTRHSWIALRSSLEPFSLQSQVAMHEDQYSDVNPKSGVSLYVCLYISPFLRVHQWVFSAGLSHTPHT